MIPEVSEALTQHCLAMRARFPKFTFLIIVWIILAFTLSKISSSLLLLQQSFILLFLAHHRIHFLSMLALASFIQLQSDPDHCMCSNEFYFCPPSQTRSLPWTQNLTLKLHLSETSLKIPWTCTWHLFRISNTKISSNVHHSLIL